MGQKIFCFLVCGAMWAAMLWMCWEDDKLRAEIMRLRQENRHLRIVLELERRAAVESRDGEEKK